MMENAKKSMHELQEYIGDISRTLSQISDKKLDIGIEHEAISLESSRIKSIACVSSFIF